MQQAGVESAWPGVVLPLRTERRLCVYSPRCPAATRYNVLPSFHFSPRRRKESIEGSGTKTVEKRKRKRDPNPRRPPSSCSTGLESKHKGAHVSQVTSTCPDWSRAASHPQLPSPGWKYQNTPETPSEWGKGLN